MLHAGGVGGDDDGESSRQDASKAGRMPALPDLRRARVGDAGFDRGVAALGAGAARECGGPAGHGGERGGGDGPARGVAAEREIEVPSFLYTPAVPGA